MTNNGAKETENTYPGGPMFLREPSPMFEKDLLTAGRDILSALPLAVLEDDIDITSTCRYFGMVNMFNRRGKCKEIWDMALWKLNATMAKKGRARDDSLQAHGRLYFPRDVSKDDKKFIAEMQQMQKQRQQQPNNNSNGEPQ